MPIILIRGTLKTLLLLGLPVMVLLLAPIVATPYLPLLDAPSHQARLAVLQNLLVTGRGSAFYSIDTLFLPNMAFDLMGLALTSWVSPAMAGRLFLAMTLTLTLGGIAVLNRSVTGRWSLVPLVAALLVYNLFVLLGFFSFDMGVALIFWALAARFGLMRRAAAIQLAAGAAMAVVLLICHVSAFGIYAITLAGYACETLLSALMSRSRTETDIRSRFFRAIMIAMELVPACFLFALMSTAGQGRARYDVPYWSSKIFNAVKSVSSGSMVADVALIAGVLAATVLLTCCGRLRLARAMWPGLVLLGLAYFVIPAHLSGGSYVDSRLPMVIAMLAIAACRFDMRPSGSAGTWLQKGLIALCLVALVAKQGALTLLWHKEGQTLARLADSLNALPAGAVILQAECQPSATDVRAVYQSRQPPLTHAAALGAADGTRFAAVSWTIKGQQPIETIPAYQPYRIFQNELSPETCSPVQVQAAATAAKAVRDQVLLTAGSADPVFLLLLRPRTSGMLSGTAALLTQNPDYELYRL